MERTINSSFDISDVFITVIIPNFNYGNYIEECLKSVINQTHKSIDLIIYDDGSVDESLNISRKILKKNRSRFRNSHIIFDSQNNGKLHALNRSIKICEAPYISIVDADDILMPDFFHKTLSRIISEKTQGRKVDFAYSDCQLIDSDGKEICMGSSQEFDKEAIKTSSYIPDCAPVSYEALCEVMPFDESIRTGTKHHKWIRLIELGYVGSYLPEPLFLYRMHENNLSGIGERVINDINNEHKKEAILSNYWGLQSEHLVN